MGLLRNSGDLASKTVYMFTYPENTTFLSIEHNEEGSFNILIPLSVLLGIVVLACLVSLLARNKRRFDHFLYCKKRNGHRSSLNEDNEYDSSLEPDSVEVEDEVGNEDNPTKSLLKGKLQINNRYENYLSTSQLSRSSNLFT